jgi:hypothetical protein
MAYVRIPVKLDPGVLMYLVVIDKVPKEKAEVMQVQPTEKFFEMVRQQAIALALEGKEPPEPIAAAIMNIADDLLAGRDVTIRAGDYIALMNFARKEKML